MFLELKISSSLENTDIWLLNLKGIEFFEDYYIFNFCLSAKLLRQDNYSGWIQEDCYLFQTIYRS